jgi:lathosterol oxidase
MGQEGKPDFEPDRGWNALPELPLTNAPIFTWPPKPITALKTIASYWLAITGRVVILLIAIACWFFLHPSVAETAALNFDWAAQIYLRNLILLVAFTGLLHAYFYTWSKQGMALKFDKRPMVKGVRAFAFSDQVRDNMFWTLASGVTIWSAYEIGFMWAFANGFMPTTEFATNPIWFVAAFLLVPLWYSFYFYWTHRFLHWPPLYRAAHSVHHRNVNVGPWSGMSMHPISCLTPHPLCAANPSAAHHFPPAIQCADRNHHPFGIRKPFGKGPKADGSRLFLPSTPPPVF